VIGTPWPVPEELEDAALERKMSRPRDTTRRAQSRELRRRGVTLALLWEEYRGHSPDGCCYSRFCDLGITATMRQSHAAGEKLFVDFAGTVPVFDGSPGRCAAKIVFAVLGASNYTPRPASARGPGLDRRPCRCAHLPGRAPKALVCDNLNAGVTAASRYEPGVNRTYQDLATHYGATIMPARPIVQRWILARLRNPRFFSLAELNVAIRTLSTNSMPA
jgi:transposase